MRQFGIRIGLNENVDNLIQDINGNKNVAGAGINMAQRVMSKADENQLLVGQAVYDTLIQREKYMSSFRKYEARVKHGARLFVYQFCEEDHDGLSIDVPTAFAPEELREHRLTDLEAYFVGLSIKHQAFLIENNGQGQHHYALILLLWFLAKDEVEKRNATATKPAYSRVAGMGKLSLYEIFNEYMKMDFWACNNLANFIIEKHFSLREYFEASPTALIFANEDAATKLRANRPDIYESLDLDTG